METNNDPQAQERDDVRCDAALQTIRDVLWRFEEASEGTRSVYDVLAFLLEDLMRDGYCPACLKDVLASAADVAKADLTKHIESAQHVYH